MKRLENENYNFYQILGVNYSSSPREIKKAYFQKAKLCHPDKVDASEKNQANNIFLKIFNAYKVLQNPNTRKMYDLYGDKFIQYFKYNQKEKVKFNYKKNEDLIRDLQCSLEEIMNITIKKIKIRKRVLVGNIVIHEENILNIRLNPSMNSGTKIRFGNQGDRLNQNIPSDLVFVIRILPNKNFSKSGYDLVFKKNISFDQSLIGFRLNFNSIDSTVINVNIFPLQQYGNVYVVKTKGFPKDQYNRDRGNLIIILNIIYPVLNFPFDVDNCKNKSLIPF